MNRFDVEIEKGGKAFIGKASVSGGMLTVESFEFGSKSASISLNNELLAKILLYELLNNSLNEGW
ncbi:MULTISPECIES: hypothetical protein [unclassified Halomonas]|uniref:hypothetical protein n=1 Tax=unclassified Halomonas TaxID=2609666 RepID=UPI0004818392|nr:MULTISPECIES: hypothetical protein [unclassified Halomonas]NAO97296.1 hypothetical protein [Halomonas sp. MG34]PKH59949.1 hypothetical protein CXF94_20105 [Halomonas sp. Choline-3u-9]QGQ70234.1 hypothetical protein FDY98_09625 [Halomonas sp. PA16-9]